MAFLLANLGGRALALHARGADWTVFAVAVALAGGACLAWPALLAPALGLFGASFFLYGFHSYRVQNQAFEYEVTVLALVFLLSLAREPGPVSRVPHPWVLGAWTLYALLALSSLLLIPPVVLGQRAFLEGGGLFTAVLEAYPSDPLYPFAGVNRLVVFVLFAALLSRHPRGRRLYRVLFRGVAVASFLAVVLGLLDFVGVVSLSGYNLSRLFYGASYDRLQSTFGNPAWYACFVSCAMPFVLLELWEARDRGKLVWGVFFPLWATSLFLAAARAAWLAGGVLLLTLGLILAVARRRSIPVPPLGRSAWPLLGATLATFAVLAVTVYGTSRGDRLVSDGAAPRLEGLRDEMRIRGLGLSSPRTIAARYALELARQSPVYGLGYETYNLHLRAQLRLPDSRVAQVVNTAIAKDRREAFFDDAHSTYLQVLAGTGLVGLALWLTLGAAGLLLVGAEVRRSGSPTAVCVLLAMVVFHFYGLFQGMQYVVVTWFLFHLAAGYAMTLEAQAPFAASRGLRIAAGALGGLVLLSLVVYGADRGYSGIKHRLGVESYLPEESEEFVGFYRPEIGPRGELRWMARRGIVNVNRAAPFSLVFVCEHPDLEREPVVLSFRFNGDPAGSIVFRRPGLVEKHFDFPEPGELRLSVSRTWSPGVEAGDPRDLGIAVGAIRWE